MSGPDAAVAKAHGDGLYLYYDTLLDSLADGVLSISPDRRVEVLNATGSAILGRDPDVVVGSSIAEAFLHDEANDGFVDAILAAVIEGSGTVKTIVDYSRDGVARRLAVASTAYVATSGPDRGKHGVVVTFNDVTETLRLREAERSLEATLSGEHAKLRTAYLKLEEAAARESRAARQTGVIRMVAAAAVLLAVAGIGLYEMRGAIPSMAAGSPNVPAGRETITVATQPIVSRVAVVGSIDAGSVVSVVGPFDGTVKEKRFDYGGAVERGQVLVVLDTADTEVKLRDGEGALIKAHQSLDTLQHWDSSPDVARARRALASAELDKTNLATRLAQTKLLLGKGIVAADEYDQLVQQQFTQNAQLAAAREDLNTVIEHGNAENRRVAEFEMKNAEVKVDDLRNDLKNATVRAPVSGVVLQPLAAEGKQADLLAVGSRVSRGQTMFAIGDLEAYAIHANVDEIDINKVHVGQAADVTSDAFEGITLHGTVVSVAAQAAVNTQSRSGMATFPIVVEISGLSPEQRARTHVGMSASLSIVTYDNPTAIVIPPAAVSEADGRKVAAVAQPDGRVVVTPITLGVSTPDGVEVRQGLRPGDVVEVGG